MKKSIIQIAVFLIPVFSFAQQDIRRVEVKRNSIYFEAFGQGLYNSLSFDRLYNIEKRIRTSFSAGITLIPHPELFVVAAPISYNYLLGKENHHLELGMGLTLMYLRHGQIRSLESFTDQNGVTQTNSFIGHSTDFYSFFTPKIGYRFQKPGGGIFIRFTITPPLAGINRIGDTKGGKYGSSWGASIEYFTSAAFFGYRAFPWAGISLGWTFKSK